MKILLVEPPFYLFQGIKPDKLSYGLAMLAASLKKDGHEVKVYSPDILLYDGKGKDAVVTPMAGWDKKMSLVKKDLFLVLRGMNPGMVCFSLWTARTKSGIDLARSVKEYDSNIVTVAGGIHATIMPDEIMAEPDIDFLIMGEGEYSLSVLARALESGEDPAMKEISGLVFRSGGKIIKQPQSYCSNLDDLPFPSYDTFIGYEQYDPDLFGSVMSSRGCPFACTYCASNLLWTRRVRFHSAAYIVDCLEYLHKKHGTTLFRFDDDTLTLKKEFVEEICRLIIVKKLPIFWRCDTRAEFITDDLIRTMKRAGLTSVSIGVESGDPEMRKKIKKDTDLEIVKNAFRICRRNGIKTTAYFMIGFPGETYEQAMKSLDLTEELDSDYPCISVFTPYPGTETYKEAVKMGIIPEKIKDWSMFYHHAGNNYSGTIEDAEWKKLLVRSEAILERANRKSRKFLRLLGRVDRRLVYRYASDPMKLIKDFKKLIKK